MVPRFSHSISLPMTMSTWHRGRGRATGHVRSVSLPCQSHPLIANLQDQIGTVRSSAASADASLAWIQTGLSQIQLLMSAVNDFLHLSESKTVLQHATSSTECLLENFLYLIDSYSSLLSDIVTLMQHQFEVQSALRRHDSALLASSLKSQRRIEKNLNHLMVSLRTAGKCPSLLLASNVQETEIFEVLKEAIGATSAASVVLFNRVVAMSSAASTSADSSVLYTINPFKKKISNEEIEKLIYVKFEELEECVRIVESGSERVLRTLVNNRVALLNIQSNSF
ncbi:hypothetical protein FCM35_KLT01779 [Carex littledalei]|uniref:Uncharacterized protein n=1 Tax=Carex littledalei TaxID=544730 RepID=A0A833VBC8_9POAL|nr:hypothetical protein FCM35_KLT01779 [Carex littledalei]